MLYQRYYLRVVGNTALGTPVVTSLGLFHQQSSARCNSERETLPSAPAHTGGGDGGLVGGCDEHDIKLLDRHTSAAKDGVIDMLTVEASKLGVSLERAMMAKREAEDRVSKLEVILVATHKLKHELTVRQHSL